MQVNFSKKSWHRRLHNFYFPHNSAENLCPYFWRVVFAVLFSFVLIAVAIICSPVLIPLAMFTFFLDFLDKKRSAINKEKGVQKFLAAIEDDNFSFAEICYLYRLYCLDWRVAVHNNDNLQKIAELYHKHIDQSCTISIEEGGNILFVTSSDGLEKMFFLDLVLREARLFEQEKEQKKKESSLIESYVKAYYNKLCPSINWE
jgi:hypothetical protein